MMMTMDVAKRSNGAEEEDGVETHCAGSVCVSRNVDKC
jgi:hypothetical protein